MADEQSITPAEVGTTRAVDLPLRAGMTAREEFSGSEMTIAAETGAAAMSAQARALVEARFIMAMRRPRDWATVRVKLLQACERPGFAGSATDKVRRWGEAWYRKPVGDGVEGFSIRFAEEAARAMTNLDVRQLVIFDSPVQRLVLVQVIDLESNLSWETTVSLEKTVERRRTRDGDEVVKTRGNSRGDTTYVVVASDDEMAQKQANAVSKAARNGILRILPGDIQQECRTRILKIRGGDVPKDPGKLVREISDGFAALNVLPEQLREYLGHEMQTATPAELQELRDLYLAIKNGEETWQSALAQALEARGEAAEKKAAEEPVRPGKGTAGLRDALRQKPREPGQEG